MLRSAVHGRDSFGRPEGLGLSPLFEVADDTCSLLTPRTSRGRHSHLQRNGAYVLTRHGLQAYNAHGRLNSTSWRHSCHAVACYDCPNSCRVRCASLWLPASLTALRDAFPGDSLAGLVLQV